MSVELLNYRRSINTQWVQKRLKSPIPPYTQHVNPQELKWPTTYTQHDLKKKKRYHSPHCNIYDNFDVDT